MSEDCGLAYIPVLHEGYRRFLSATATTGACS